MDLLRGGVKSEDGLQRHRLLVDLGRIDGSPFTLVRHQVFGNTAVRRKHTRLGELNCTRAAVGAQILANAAAVLTKFAVFPAIWFYANARPTQLSFKGESVICTDTVHCTYVDEMAGARN